MPEVDTDRVRRDWMQRGFSCDTWIDPPGQVWADFVHDTDELVMLVAGGMELTVGERTLRPGIGEEILIQAHTPHTVRATGNTGNRWLYGYRRR